MEPSLSNQLFFDLLSDVLEKYKDVEVLIANKTHASFLLLKSQAKEYRIC